MRQKEQAIPKELDAFFPFRGGCGMCGGPDARHRLLDAIAGRIKAGDLIVNIAHEYRLSDEAVDTVQKYWLPIYLENYRLEVEDIEEIEFQTTLKIDPQEMVDTIVGLGHDAAFAFIVAIDEAVEDWAFTQKIIDYTEEMKELKRQDEALVKEE